MSFSESSSKTAMRPNSAATILSELAPMYYNIKFIPARVQHTLSGSMTTSAPYLLATVYKAARIDVSDGRTLSQRWDLGLRFLSPIYPSVDAMSTPQSQLPLFLQALVYKLSRLFPFTSAGCWGKPVKYMRTTNNQQREGCRIDARDNRRPPGDPRRTPSRELLVSPQSQTSNISRIQPWPSQPHCKRLSGIRSLPERSSTPSSGSFPNVDSSVGALEDRTFRDVPPPLL